MDCSSEHCKIQERTDRLCSFTTGFFKVRVIKEFDPSTVLGCLLPWVCEVFFRISALLDVQIKNIKFFVEYMTIEVDGLKTVYCQESGALLPSITENFVNLTSLDD